jgi:hypothetical protein
VLNFPVSRHTSEPRILIVRIESHHDGLKGTKSHGLVILEPEHYRGFPRALISVGTHKDDRPACSTARFPLCQNTTKMLYTIEPPKRHLRTIVPYLVSASLWASISSVSHDTEAMAVTRISNIQWETCEQYLCAMPVPIFQPRQLCHYQNRRNGPHETTGINSLSRLLPDDFRSLSLPHTHTPFSC